MNIPYEDLKRVNAPFMAEMKQAAANVIESGWYILGQEVEKFEQAFATYNHAKYCVGVASGLDALRLGLMAFDLPSGSEVIVAANSYVATILAVTQAGCTPVLVEPRLEDGNLDVSKIETAITKKTRAIMPVHCYGQPCEMKKMCELVEKYNLILIEDCAQAHGATYQGQKVGTFGQVGAFSFYPTKNLGALGDGGAIVTNSKETYEKIKSLRNYGETSKYHNQYLGLNSRLDEMQAAFLSIKLKALDEINAHKQALAQIYYNNLNSALLLPPKDEKTSPVYHIFNLRHEQRSELQAHLLERGVRTAIHYPTPPYKQPSYQHLSSQDFPVSNQWHATTLSLPISFGHTPQEIEYVAQCINEFAA